MTPNAIPISGKRIAFSGHALKQIGFRGTTEQEVIDAITTEAWYPAELGRLDCRKDIAYNAEWNRVHYATKQVRSIFVDEPDEIVVVTVYV